MRRTITNFSLTVLAILMLLVCGGCTDDYIDGGETFEEGLPATVSFNISMAEIPEMTRATNTDDNFISDLYVAIFSGDSEGKRLFSKHYSDVIDNEDIDIIDDQTGTIAIKNLELTSTVGARIVAIANIANENKGYITAIDTYYNTFNKMKMFTFSNADPTDINHYGTTFLMSGWYADSKADFTKNIETISTVDIKPGINKLPGAIYLYRLASQNIFRIKAGDNVSLKINTWQVCNVPKYSYMFERGSSSGQFSSSYVDSKTAHTFASETEGNYTYKTFEFYLLENIHTACNYASLGTDASGNADWVGIRNTAGLSSIQLYRDREREYKNADGTNSGIYKSLIANHTEGNDDDENLSNNYASYVVVNADIDYYIEDTEANRQDPSGEQALPVAYDASMKLIHRTANVDYTIHLGFCKDKDSSGNATVATAMDFNCNRNTKYTYNVTINGVKNVVVEATSDGEPEPGAEGSVYDAYSDEVELDAHYCEFNISLSDEERATLAYRITAPYGNGAPYKFYVDGKYNGYDSAWDDESNPESEFFTWIKFYPTTDKNTLAEYDKSTVWSIECLRHPEEYPNTTTDSNGDKWFTVFVDEYVYHKDDSADGTDDSWQYYVNKDNRMVELIKQSNISADGESSYSFCKYVFAQKSIQTFYNTSSPTALGIEHTDETFCLNTIWGGGQSSSHSTSYYSFNDGAHNLWNFAGKRSYQWSNFISATTPCVVYADSCTNTDVMTHHAAASYPVYQPALVGRQTSVTYLNNNGFPSPHDERYFYGNGSCMTRNRDLNHNGVIDADEIRWYLPTSNEYIQIAIGQGELPDPLMQFGDHDRNELKDNTDREGTYYYHYLTSDYQYFWAEQGLSVGDGPFKQAKNQCYSVRCVRQLGTSRSEATLNSVASPVAATYTHDATDRTFTMNNYNENSLRGYSASALAPHTIASVAGRPYKKFEYAADVCRNMSDSYVSVDANGLLSYADSYLNTSSNNGDSLLVKRSVAWTKSLRYNGICKKYTQETDGSDQGSWRVPNFKELAFMYIEGLIQTSTSLNNNYVASCTYDFFSVRQMWKNSTVTGPYFGYNDTSNRKVLARDILYQSETPSATKIKIRCVRDVE